jgi:Protein of unknown function (DUF4239)
MQWIYSVPLFPLGVLITIVFVGVGLSGMWLTQKFILPRLNVSAHDNEFTGAIIHGMLVIYGLAVALIVVAVWENYADVSKLVSREATAIAMLYRDVGAYPDSTSERLQHSLRTYTDEIIGEAWPLQRRGIIPTHGVELMNNFEDIIFAFAPKTEEQKILHAEALHAYNNLIEARRLRLDAVRSGLPGAMWAVVLLGALISLTSSFMFRVESAPLHYTMVSLLAALMGLVVFLILIYDSPFRGTHGVGSEAYELIRDHLMRNR